MQNAIMPRLPVGLADNLTQTSGTAYLEALATASREHPDLLLPLYRPVAAEVFARWLLPSKTSSNTLTKEIITLDAIARTLPFVPYLLAGAETFLHNSQVKRLIDQHILPPNTITDDELRLLLTALFRLVSFDLHTFRSYVPPIFLTSLLQHDDLSIRYIVIACTCRTVGLADAVEQDLVRRFVGTEQISGSWEDQEIDYRLFKLHEEQRWARLHADLSIEKPEMSLNYSLTDLSPTVAAFEDILIPRENGAEGTQNEFVRTKTARAAIRQMGKALLSMKAILITGPSGSGKSALVSESARLLNKSSSMITLHLNDQTDAKSLIGVYVSSADGSGFVWQPGVLTKAVQEGRWVLIEDINRVPAEVIGLLRPLIANNELSLPTSKTKIRPTNGFRILGTITQQHERRTGTESRLNLFGNETLWSMVNTSRYEPDEISTLIGDRFPALRSFQSQMRCAHEKVEEAVHSDMRFRAARSRVPSLRDLFKWCDRTTKNMINKQISARMTEVSESFLVHMLQDALDCYAAHLDDNALVEVIALVVASQLNVAPNVARHVLTNDMLSFRENESSIQVGRAQLRKLASSHGKKLPQSTFSLTRQARKTIEAVAAASTNGEPLLLVGETGIGKTTVIQHLAKSLSQQLTVVNLSQQSEAADLLGGLKPLTTRTFIMPLLDQFNPLFDDTFNASKNQDFRSSINRALSRQKWTRVLERFEQAVKMALETFERAATRTTGDESVVKRRKIDDTKYVMLRERWTAFEKRLGEVRAQVGASEKNQIFAFVESRLVAAVREGHWLLLDEINLASSDALDHVLTLLKSNSDEKPYLLLAEAGSVEKITAHPDFRLFAAMNPATDAGKKDLPPAIRSQFTELYVRPGDDDIADLTLIIESYIGRTLHSDKKAASDLARTYLSLKGLATQNKLVDGAGDVPHFSLRSLTRTLQFVRQQFSNLGLRRAMYEGLQMSFCTLLDQPSRKVAMQSIEGHVFAKARDLKTALSQKPKLQAEQDLFVNLGDHRVLKGVFPVDPQEHYIITKSVEDNLKHLARATSMARFPVLLQGPTSAGKTSMVEYLAKLTGNKFVRINNHEHTDLQEYLGSYASGSDGKLEYREGVLVEALKKGYWIVLDELNLAPSDVLEALNRLLDDNRELLIPESQEIVRPHPSFMLFATQNPAGLYGGRKHLSRAFRNRFLEIHFEDIPESELEIILEKRAQLPPSYCREIVEVYRRLALRRQSTKLFEQRNSFATLRDLFRWASRPADNRQQLAQHGYMLLGERVRNDPEKQIVKSTLESVFKVQLSDTVLYAQEAVPQAVLKDSSITWTGAMRRLYILVSTALANNEPVLLVGDTGCGKTQICQSMAKATGHQLDIYNAHANTESGDLIGSQRPLRGRAEIARDLESKLGNLSDHFAGTDLEDMIARFQAMDTSTLAKDMVEDVRKSVASYQSLFAWTDGSLVRAMKSGNYFLMDEISLADDSVLERLNSVLEPSRSILLAEKGAQDNFVVASSEFQFLATMNPGGDYGKRELSAALRNRLTEIWVPPLSKDEDIIPIISSRLEGKHKTAANAMLQFAKFFKNEFQNSMTATIPLRGLIAWAQAMSCYQGLGFEKALVHGCAMVYIDSLGANPAGLISRTLMNVDKARSLCLQALAKYVGFDTNFIYFAEPKYHVTDEELRVGDFAATRNISGTRPSNIVLEATTTRRNAMRLLRGLQVARPILLEGNPGVGKTAIVTALAAICGKPLARINLSDQTDLMDLFGSDAPAEGAEVGSFVWRDGPVLQAMQRGEWVLLDEMNLASQSVLEGLNACLDHRREVYVAELDKTFICHPDFMLFATQNPHHQGGGRKGLPASFVNRFNVVYADPLVHDDLLQICRSRTSFLDEAILRQMIETISKCQEIATQHPRLADGGPWELNLRDVDRWVHLVRKYTSLSASTYFDSLICARFRSAEARHSLTQVCSVEMGDHTAENLYHNLTSTALQVGTTCLPRNKICCDYTLTAYIPTHQLHYARSVMLAIGEDWPVILTGPTGAGKTSLLRSLAAFSGSRLQEFAITPDTDTADLVGGYEQYDHLREMSHICTVAQGCLLPRLTTALKNGNFSDVNAILMAVSTLKDTTQSPDAIRLLLTQLAGMDEGFVDLLSQYNGVVKANQQTSTARFAWKDGILIDALERGDWLVLDNANLCSSSVLDRLNSLLEPGGSLILSEQHGSDGKARVIRPHPNFRIFLTTDAKYGELSRAMRNRSLEIFMVSDGWSGNMSTGMIAYATSSELYRLRTLLSCAPSRAHGIDDESEPWYAHLSNDDSKLLPEIDDEVLSSGNPQRLMLDTKLTTSAVLLQHETEMIDQGAWQMQPSTLLLNEPMLQRLEGAPPLVSIAKSQMQLQYLVSVVKNGLRLLQAVQDQQPRINDPKSTAIFRSYNALQRSSRSTDGMLSFIYPAVKTIFTAITDALQQITTSSHDATDFMKLNHVVIFASDFIKYFDTPATDDTMTRAYIDIGRSLTAKAEAFTVVRAIRTALSTLADPLKLRTGQYMQQMWPSWRSRTVGTESQLRALLKMEDTIKIFDEYCKCAYQNVTELANVRYSLVTAYQTVVMREDAESQVDNIAKAVDELVTQRNSGRMARPGHFSPVFTSIMRLATLSNEHFHPEIEQKLQLLTLHPALPGLLDSEIAYQTLLNSLTSLTSGSLAADTDEKPLTAATVPSPASIASSISAQSSSELGLLSFLVEEHTELLKTLSSSARLFELDMDDALRSLCIRLIGATLSSVDDTSSLNNNEGAPVLEAAAVARLVHEMKASVVGKSTIIDSILSKDLVPSSVFLTDQAHLSSGKALLLASLAALKLFVPDKAFDPAIGPRLTRQRWLRQVEEYNHRIRAYRSFQMQMTGQQTSAAIRLLEEQLVDLGDEPSEVLVFRPESQHLQSVQSEFSNLVRNVIESEVVYRICFEDERDIRSNCGLLMSRIQAILPRLQNIHRGYDDMTKPICAMLSCMLFGTRVVSETCEIDSNGNLAIWNFALRSSAAPSSDPTSITTKKVQLEEITLMSHITGKDREQLYDVVIQFLSITDEAYRRWKDQLSSDQAKAEIDSKYYAYRGDDDQEVNEEDVRTMFPTYDEDSLGTDILMRRSVHDGVATATLARYHRALFADSDSFSTFKTYLRDHELAHSADGGDVSKSFPSILLLAEQAGQMLESRVTSTSLNVYTDHDTNEVRRLCEVLEDLRQRFHQISERWPDHSVPLEVLDFIEQAMRLPLDTPIAKLMTKAEKLLDIVSQWQSVASKEWSVSDLCDKLTSIIISWRRLELSSWSRLLDEETAKQNNENDSWYIIAYEAVIHNSLAVTEQQSDVLEYCEELAKALEEYMIGSTLGQFSNRLQLLQMLNRTLDIVCLKNQNLGPICQTITNVVNHYRRYDESISKQLSEGRASLEKIITEQIKLASWKDVNVIALRESAKRSHFKLFKIVKKYRALLNKPVDVLRAPEIAKTVLEPLSPLDSHSADAKKISSYEQIYLDAIPARRGRRQRLTNSFVAAEAMAHLYSTSNLDFNASLELSAYREDVLTSMDELRKATPTMAQKENEAMVRNLKLRKRKLLADTMRDLFGMGVRRNLGTKELTAQSSTSIVLASCPSLTTNNNIIPEIANASFHEILDTAPTVRQAASEHSPELTDGEVRRGIGLAEGMISIILAQRCDISIAQSSAEPFSRLLKALQRLQNTDLNNLRHWTAQTGERNDALAARQRWLAELLRVYAHVAELQCKHGQLRVEDIVHSMREHSACLIASAAKLPRHNSLVGAFVEADALHRQQEAAQLLQDIRRDLDRWAAEQPNLIHIVTPLLPFTDTYDPLTSETNGVVYTQVTDIDSRILEILDLVFAALQKMAAALQHLPTSAEDQAWLSKTSTHLNKAIKSLHVADITVKLQQIVAEASRLPATELRTGLAMILTLVPVLGQYNSIHHHLVERLIHINAETSRLACSLMKAFCALSKEGFCTPHEPSDSNDNTAKVESGTGLGEGDAAEDISKDIGDDEDLSELAQQNAEREHDKQEMDKSKDAVDMGVDDLEGEMGSGDEAESDVDKDDDQSTSGEEQDMDEENGSVDDLDPSAVDEKMWDDMQRPNEKSEKEMESQKAQGEQTDDQAAREEGEGEQQQTNDVDSENDVNEDDMNADDEPQARPEGENVDPNLKEEDKLDLPEDLDMQLDGEKDIDDDISDAGMEDMSDVEQETEKFDEVQQDESTTLEDKELRNEDVGEHESVADNEEGSQTGRAEDDEILEDQPDVEQDLEDEHDTRQNDPSHGIEEQDAGESGQAAQAKETLNANEDENAPQGLNDAAHAATETHESNDVHAAAEQDGTSGTESGQQGVGRDDRLQDRQDDALKKFADVIEQYHKRREIFTQDEDRQRTQVDQDVNMGDADMEHVGEEEHENDIQALGTTANEHAQNLTEGEAIEDESSNVKDDLPMPEDAQKEQILNEETLAERYTRVDHERTEAEKNERAGAMSTEALRDAHHSRQDQEIDLMEDVESFDNERYASRPKEQVTQPDQQQETSLLAIDEAHRLWSMASNRTQALSLVLTEQLRLILQPTTATKLRGDFRTGKRLNIRRIISYISSGYKKDKIWMRRSVPSKRNYQVMLAVDDSKSMAESGADVLALETLCLLSRALSGLEVGELSVLAFGQQYGGNNTEGPNAIRLAHPFSSPFAPSHSGPEAFRNFSFQQRGTNVQNLLRESIGLFRDARLKSSAREAADLWQLQLIISDGHIGSDHDSVRRLVRQAREERIMCVFVIVDAGKESIIDLPEVYFEPVQDKNGQETGETVMRTRRYLENFPFQYYVVVRDITDLPGTLSRILKGWFESVVETG